MSVRAFLHPAVVGMGLHVASVRVRRAVRGYRRHDGTAEDILRVGLEGCWSGRYLTASPGHYRQFWTRDTGFAAPALARLGEPHGERLLMSLAWAIDVWRQRGSHVTTTINPLLRGPLDIFDYGVDSLPLLLASLRAIIAQPATASRAEALAHEHSAWIAAEVEHYLDRVVDSDTGLVRPDRHFSAHRDTFRNSSTAYANTMVALLGRTVAETGWGPDRLSRHFGGATSGATSGASAAPPAGVGTYGRAGPGATSGAAGVGDVAPGGVGAHGSGWPHGSAGAHRSASAPDWGSLLRRHFWLGDRFRDRLGSDETSGEANVWPFFAGLFEDGGMLAAALGTLGREGYATPYPLRFQAAHGRDGMLLLFRLYSPDYQTTTSWTSLGSIYLSLLREVDPLAAAVELDRMRRLIERDGTFWEVLDDRGRAWRSRSRLSVSDHSMLWGAILLETLENPEGPPLRIR